MKSVILLLFLMSFTSCKFLRELTYKHKSEAEIAAMTPAQRFDELANEQAYHKYDVLDEQSRLIRKYIRLDGLKTLPRIIEIINEYDPMSDSGKSENKGEHFDAAWMTLDYIDNSVVRIRSSEEGRQAIDALERATERMRAAGNGQQDQHEWAEHGRFDLAITMLESLKGVNKIDSRIRETFRFFYKINMSDAELLEFSNFLAVHYSDYPSWSETNNFPDNTQINEAGNSIWIHSMKEPERYYEAYLEFKKTK